jgi:hypothetical protein
MERMANEYGISRNRQYTKIVSGSNTATYLALLEEDGDLHTAITDMDVLTQIQVPDEEVSYAQDLLFVQLYS